MKNKVISILFCLILICGVAFHLFTGVVCHAKRKKWETTG